MQRFGSLAAAIAGLSPQVMGAASAVIFAAGIFLQAQENRSNLAKAAALLDGPPPATEPAGMTTAAARHPFAEVSVTAQLDLSMVAPLVSEGEAGPVTAYLVPLLDPAAARIEDAEVLGLLLHRTPVLPAPEGAAEQGAFGPIVRLNGFVGDFGDLGAFGPLASEQLNGAWRDMPEGLPVLRSFDGARAAAYGPAWRHEISIFGFFAWPGGACGILALLLAAVRQPAAGRREAEEALTEDDRTVIEQTMAAA